MLSIEMIRNNPEYVRDCLESRGADPKLDEILRIDSERRSCITNMDSLRARRNEVSKTIGRMKGDSSKLVGEMREVGASISTLEQNLKLLQQQLDSILLELPNIPDDNTPKGQTVDSNVIIRSHGKARNFSFVPLPHWELSESLGIIDFQRGAKLSGSRFYVSLDKGAYLERALINWMIDIHIQTHKYREVQVPLLVRQDIMTGSGNLPKFADNLYHDKEDDLWLIPTGEVPLTSLHRDEILSNDALPIRYVTVTPCFRREKAAAGRDTRGIKRVHQFNKVELYKIVEPEFSPTELESLVNDAEEICKLLEIPYRIIELCTGDLGFASSKSYDIEMWAPGSEEWLEVSSCSNCTDFQARRSNVRYRHQNQSSPKFVHTLNGSGLALPRVIISILENYQEQDGSISIPKALHPYTTFKKIESP